MKLTIPFINFNNYVVLKCYTNNKLVCDGFPIVLSSRLPSIKAVSDASGGLRTCYGYTSSLKRSASLPMWMSIGVRSVNGEVGLAKPDERSGVCDFDFSHNEDAYLKLDSMVVVKIIPPWVLEEATGVQFILASNIRNNTPMKIPSGVCDFKYQHAINVFNYISTYDHSYEVTAGTPVLALYPMTDKKLYVESHYDVKKFEELSSKTSTRAFFSSNTAKIKKAICSHAK